MDIKQQLVWLRNDLRLDDNPALALAQQQGPIRVVFFATPKQWKHHNESEARLGLKAEALVDIAQRLAEKGIPFDYIECDMFDDITKALLDLCARESIDQVWFNAETPVDEQARDKAIADSLGANNIHVKNCGFDLLVSRDVLNLAGQPFKVFTPFYKRWLQFLNEHLQAVFSEPNQQSKALPYTPLELSWAGDFRDDLWPAAEADALQRLNKFCQRRMHNYNDNRDIPSIAGTSSLSPYLANGQLGPRRCLEVIRLCCAQEGRDWQSDHWLRELAWRDFYRQLMHHFPRLSKNKAFKVETEIIVWNDSSEIFNAWCEGRTGFPIVDAAMRQLLQTGWMHNRLRMVAASFLTKILFVDWRKGEKFFMQHLIDGEFCANNGGWQWSASTGCDAAPYFRIFNPVRQSERFDGEGVFIRRFVPELSELSAKEIHNPSPESRLKYSYPEPIVDYKSAREFAIASFKNLKAVN